MECLLFTVHIQPVLSHTISLCSSICMLMMHSWYIVSGPASHLWQVLITAHCTLHTRHCKELEARKKKKIKKKCDDITEVLPLKCMSSSTASTFSGINIFPRLSGVLLLWATLAASLSLHWLQYWNKHYCASDVKAHVCFVFLPFPLHHLVDLPVWTSFERLRIMPLLLFSKDEKQTYYTYTLWNTLAIGLSCNWLYYWPNINYTINVSSYWCLIMNLLFMCHASGKRKPFIVPLFGILFLFLII